LVTQIILGEEYKNLKFNCHIMANKRLNGAFLQTPTCLHVVSIQNIIQGKKCKVVPTHAMKSYRGTEIQLTSFLTLALYGNEWLTLRPGPLYPGKQPRYPLYITLGRP
jgi:hypothetical protein